MFFRSSILLALAFSAGPAAVAGDGLVSVRELAVTAQCGFDDWRVYAGVALSDGGEGQTLATPNGGSSALHHGGCLPGSPLLPSNKECAEKILFLVDTMGNRSSVPVRDGFAILSKGEHTHESDEIHSCARRRDHVRACVTG